MARWAERLTLLACLVGPAAAVRGDAEGRAVAEASSLVEAASRAEEAGRLNRLGAAGAAHDIHGHYVKPKLPPDHQVDSQKEEEEDDTQGTDSTKDASAGDDDASNNGDTEPSTQGTDSTKDASRVEDDDSTKDASAGDDDTSNNGDTEPSPQGTDSTKDASAAGPESGEDLTEREGQTDAEPAVVDASKPDAGDLEDHSAGAAAAAAAPEHVDVGLKDLDEGVEEEEDDTLGSGLSSEQIAAQCDVAVAGRGGQQGVKALQECVAILQKLAQQARTNMATSKQANTDYAVRLRVARQKLQEMKELMRTADQVMMGDYKNAADSHLNPLLDALQSDLNLMKEGNVDKMKEAKLVVDRRV